MSEIKCILLSITASTSRKSGNAAYYAAVSYNGQSKRVYLREMPQLSLVPSAENPKLFLPRAGTMAVILSYELGGYGEQLGVDVKGMREE